MAAIDVHADAADWFYVGRHASRIDEEDLSFTTILQGALTLEEYDRINAVLQAALRDQRVRFFVLDVSDTTTVKPEVRRRLGHNVDALLPEAMLIVGAAAAVRLLANLIRRARELLGRPNGTTVLFCKDLAEARRWVSRRRAGERPSLPPGHLG